jgi:sugar transferase (PEP-CTERM/EpsH1 system associated)
VLFLTHRLPYAPNRGDRLRAYHMLRVLSGRADVDLISLVHDDEEEAHAGDLEGVAQHVYVARAPKLRNLVRGALSLAGSRPLTHSLLDAPGIRGLLRRAAQAHPPDAVFAYCSGMARFAMMSPLAQVPCVLDMVDADSAKWSALAKTSGFPKSLIYAREGRCLSRFEIDAMRHAKTTLVVNERERQLLHGLDPQARVLVMENGVDLDSFAPPDAPSAAPDVVFCGVMNYAPNEEGARWIARDVWPLVRQTRPDARLVLVGATPSPLVKALASDAHNIVVTGTVPDVRPYLWKASVAAAPLWTARGVQNKVLEAIAAGLPAAITPPVAEGLPPEAHPACTLASTPEAFARALLELLALSPFERRARAHRASLAPLAWRERLRALPDLLEEAARSTDEAASVGTLNRAPVRDTGR